MCPYPIVNDIYLDLIYVWTQTQAPRRKRATHRSSRFREVEMRKYLWIILAGLLLAIGAPNAHAGSCPVNPLVPARSLSIGSDYF
jgi:hypothetical protein